MTYHILHITTRGTFLSVDRGHLVCKYPDDTEKRMALSDIRAIIAGIQGISFSNECIARLIENDAIILHCNNQYKPVGWTMPFDRVIRQEAFLNQLKQNKDFNHKLWKNILQYKFENQSYILNYMEIENSISELSKRPLPSEANIAKHFWNKYFKGLGSEILREHKNAENFENKALNYGYAVVQSLLYRSILIHGLLPNLGIHHKARYNSTPLVYDLLEPLRGFVELFLYKFFEKNQEEYEEQDFKNWIKYLAESLRHCRLQNKQQTHKFMDAIDVYVNSIVRAFINLNNEELWIPSLENHYWCLDNNSNRENEE
ncbi:MAG: type II CRISPR-associated endonuclease Cas1 [bacterium]